MPSMHGSMDTRVKYSIAHSHDWPIYAVLINFSELQICTRALRSNNGGESETKFFINHSQHKEWLRRRQIGVLLTETVQQRLLCGCPRRLSYALIASDYWHKIDSGMRLISYTG